MSQNAEKSDSKINGEFGIVETLICGKNTFKAVKVESKQKISY